MSKPYREWSAERKERNRISSREWARKNPEYSREKNRAWRKANPERNRELRRKWAKANAEKVRAGIRAWAKANPHKIKAARLRHAYGLSAQELDLLLGRMGVQCPICRVRNTNCIDHNHATGKIRSLLCRQCNTMLGMASDDPDALRRAASYLETFK